MEMRRIEVFCKVVELRSFTKAGEALQLSQPTVSEHIRGLEDALGEKLFDRAGREINPTPAAKLFYQYARNIIQLREEAIQALGRFREDLAGDLTVGASTIPGTYLLPKLTASFKAAHPSAHMVLKIADSERIALDVIEGDVDAGVIGTLFNHRKLLHEELFDDELVLAVLPRHPWAKKRSIDIEGLRNEPFILRERGSGTRAVMTRIMQEQGFDLSTLDVVAEMGSTEAVRQGIKAGIGVSILSYQAVREDFDHGLLTPVEIANFRFVRPLYLIQKKGREPTPLCSAFLAHLRCRADGESH